RHRCRRRQPLDRTNRRRIRRSRTARPPPGPRPRRERCSGKRSTHAPDVRRTSYLALIALFFAWGFVMHGAGLLLHEFGGHALSATLFACGIDGHNLTLFGHGLVHYPSCARWTTASTLITEWSGLTVTIAVGLAALLFGRRRHTPLARLLLALVAFFFL